MKEEEKVFKVEGGEGWNLEFFICETNELNPYRDTKELGVVVFKEKEQIDFELIEGKQIDDLINYLNWAKEVIAKFNESTKSKPVGQWRVKQKK